MSKDATPEEKSEGYRSLRHPHYFIQYTFLAKALALVATTMYTGLDAHQPVRIPVLLKSLYHGRSLRVRDFAPFGKAHKEIDKVIRWTVDEDEIPRKARYRCDDPDHPDVKYRREISTDYMRWLSCPDDGHVVFRDFAVAARILRTSYFDQINNKCLAEDDDTFTGPSCFHRNSICLLDWLQKKAWTEIRVSVLHTVGSLLPAELTDKIFEHALDAEEIPADPCLSETFHVEPDSKVIRHRERKGLKPLQPRSCERTREIYKCCRIKDPNPDPSLVFATYLDREFDKDGVGVEERFRCRWKRPGRALAISSRYEPDSCED
ncbi:hypothetical protein LTR37_012040 [Vermiconidia calcicola]|uniref:Uncharacterized protein n=1 Tax=Vermiconidia calcicola TaxID=1690605 RepID=A0ACC3N084_9PEZI|nr:hypothetical protein LTR37_012040 [Vermiconidia calcicola]